MWHGSVNWTEVYDDVIKKTNKALSEAWDEEHIALFKESENSAYETRQKKTLAGYFSRIIHAIDTPSPQLRFDIITEQDGVHHSRIFTLMGENVVDRIKQTFVDSSRSGA
ncbi:hypothetical protein AARI_22770 [Glutamicibacter arilaitensis Re117]|uniref:Uncharacterized protein n=1 Tax=Glutamicibacter arilaitensis (strain DSM 16368 / CIP 108037 / IAM 15318 / JCM 13566 / NCIMB 14258 / Re117) TaxID=861360 RepID=A0ABM9PYU5_GLUAR|nr:hypothetical protein AARI_22770 [Glutamicibacter arilaitensis Re117]